MRMPRFTIRRMMVGVAVIALPLCAYVERQSRFRQAAAQHSAALPALLAANKAQPNDILITAKMTWHVMMRSKYERAAKRPWLPVAPDQPFPK